MLSSPRVTCFQVSTEIIPEYVIPRYFVHHLRTKQQFNAQPKWSCRACVPISQLIWAAFRSKAKGLLPPDDERRCRGL